MDGRERTTTITKSSRGTKLKWRISTPGIVDGPKRYGSPAEQRAAEFQNSNDPKQARVRRFIIRLLARQ